MKVQVQATYLGDILNCSGDINDTITAREMKAIGINSQIFSMLNSLSLGMFYFDIALVMRDAMLINAILTNSESWPFISKKNMNTLESADSQLMQKIFQSHSKTVRESYYIETGKLQIKFLIGKRRLMYLWHILSCNKDELIYKVYMAQSLKPTHNDWFKMIQHEKIFYDIELTDQQISGMSRSHFKKIVDDKVNKKSLLLICQT